MPSVVLRFPSVSEQALFRSSGTEDHKQLGSLQDLFSVTGPSDGPNRIQSFIPEDGNKSSFRIAVVGKRQRVMSRINDG